MKETKQRFLKGIDKRVNIESNTDPDRLFTLQNARLQSRGNTSDIERIKGSEVIDKEFTKITVDELRSAIVEGSEASGTFEITNITNEIEPGTPSTGYIGIDNVDPSGACDLGDPLVKFYANYEYNGVIYAFTYDPDTVNQSLLCFQYDISAGTWDSGTAVSANNITNEVVWSSNLEGTNVWLLIPNVSLISIDLTDFSVNSYSQTLFAVSETWSLFHYNGKLYSMGNVATTSYLKLFEGTIESPYVNGVEIYAEVEDANYRDFIGVDSVNGKAYYLGGDPDGLNGYVMEVDIVAGTITLISSIAISNYVESRFHSILYDSGNLYIYNRSEFGLISEFVKYDISADTFTTLSPNSSNAFIQPILYNGVIYLLDNTGFSGNLYHRYLKYEISSDSYLTPTDRVEYFNGTNPTFRFNVNCVGLDSFLVRANRCDTPEQLAIKIKLFFDNAATTSPQNAFYTTQINFDTKWYVEYTSIIQGPTEDRVLYVDSPEPLPDSADT